MFEVYDRTTDETLHVPAGQVMEYLRDGKRFVVRTVIKTRESCFLAKSVYAEQEA